MIAIDQYRRYRADFDQLGAMHHNAHRFSIEWARVEPQPGRFDHGALDHYADVVRACRSSGMEPVVTLQHFTLPVWLAESGGFAAPEAPVRFARYAAACVEAFGDMVTWWVTVNEPMVVAVLGHLEGLWAPGERSLRRTLGALRGLLRMHAAAAQAITTVSAHHGRETQVSIAHHERRFVPATRRHASIARLRRCPISFSIAGFCAAASPVASLLPSGMERQYRAWQARSPTWA